MSYSMPLGGVLARWRLGAAELVVEDDAQATVDKGVVSDQSPGALVVLGGAPPDRCGGSVLRRAANEVSRPPFR
jgi:hypothetical protein